MNKKTIKILFILLVVILCLVAIKSIVDNSGTNSAIKATTYTEDGTVEPVPDAEVSEKVRTLSEGKEGISIASHNLGVSIDNDKGDTYYTVRNIKDIDDCIEFVTAPPGFEIMSPTYDVTFTVPATNEGKKVKTCTMYVRPMYGKQQLDLYRKESENSEWEKVGTYSVDPSPNAYETSYTFTYEE